MRRTAVCPSSVFSNWLNASWFTFMSTSHSEHNSCSEPFCICVCVCVCYWTSACSCRLTSSYWNAVWWSWCLDFAPGVVDTNRWSGWLGCFQTASGCPRVAPMSRWCCCGGTFPSFPKTAPLTNWLMAKMAPKVYLFTCLFVQAERCCDKIDSVVKLCCGCWLFCTCTDAAAQTLTGPESLWSRGICLWVRFHQTCKNENAHKNKWRNEEVLI